MGKKRKSYFNNNQEKSGPKKFKFNNKIKLGPNMKGYLISYNCKFTFCLNEAKKLLDQYSIKDDVEKAASSEAASNNDIEKQLKEELEGLNKRDKELVVLDTNAKHTIFILSGNDSDPNRVVTAIFETIESSKKPLGRFVQRLVPVLNTCKAYVDDIEKCMKETLDQMEAVQKSDTTPITFCCVFKTSNNNQISRDSVFKLAGSYMQSKNKANKVDFDAPDYVLFVHIVCNICFLSFLPKYFEFRKYNLVEMGCKFIPQAAAKPAVVAATAKSEEATKKEAAEDEKSNSSSSSEDDDDYDDDDNGSDEVETKADNVEAEKKCELKEEEEKGVETVAN